MQPFETVASAKNLVLKRFFDEVIRGLTALPKYLSSKYFYDSRGDSLFRHIMHAEEYYLSHCELEILSGHAEEIAAKVESKGETIDVVELGPGDASKSIYLLEKLDKKKAIARYIPIDISANVINLLKETLTFKIPTLDIQSLNGEYFDMLDKIRRSSDKRKLVLFLGANIGNYAPAAAVHFCQNMRQYLKTGDKVLIGIDLKKHPQTILNAYNDRKGYTRSFNLNLLHRINIELNADFEIGQFDHYPMYDPGSGTCKSYLISRCAQKVHIGSQEINFDENETIFMEISQKYTVHETKLLAAQSGFVPVAEFFDSKEWFVDCLWDCQ